MKAPFNQCDKRWGSKQLGTIPGTYCQYGCYESDEASVANDSGHPTTPDAFGALLVAKHLYISGDLIADDVLDKAYPGDYVTSVYPGFHVDVIRTAVPSPDRYVRLYIDGYSPGWGMNVSHFVFAWTADGKYVGDPEGGVIRTLAFYGGPANVKKTIETKRVRPAPAPTPVFSVVQGKAVLAKGLLFAAAVTQARVFAAAHIGQLFSVLDAKGATVDTEYVAPAPLQIPPETKPLPTPLPSKDPTFWDWLDQFLIRLVIAVRGIPTTQ